MAIDLVIKNGKIVNPTGIIEAGIAIDTGKIIAIGTPASLPSANKTIDAGGNYILPGLIDPHVHYRFEWPDPGQCITGDSQSSVAGGVTVFGNFMRAYTKSPLDLLTEHQKIVEEYSLIDGFFHVNVTPDFIDYIPKLPEKGIASFKFLMAYKGLQAKMTGAPVIDDGVIFDGFERISKLGWPARAMVHCENIDIAIVLAKRLQAAGRNDMPAWEESRPSFVEAEAMRRVIYFAQVTKCPLYIVHITIGEGVDIIAEAKAKGIDVVAETCPQYLTHSSKEPAPIFIKHPTWGNVNPPLRDKWSNEKLWQGIRDGWIDCIGSDYAPLTLEQKGDDIWKARMGNGLSQMILPVMLSEGVNKGRISMEKIAEVCCYNAAKIFGLLPQKGTINVGSDADLVIVDLNKKVTVSNDTLNSSFIGWTIYEGWEFKGWPILTMLRGRVIMQNGQILGEPGYGKFIPCRQEAIPTAYQR